MIWPNLMNVPAEVLEAQAERPGEGARREPATRSVEEVADGDGEEVPGGHLGDLGAPAHQRGGARLGESSRVDPRGTGIAADRIGHPARPFPTSAGYATPGPPVPGRTRLRPPGATRRRLRDRRQRPARAPTDRKRPGHLGHRDQQGEHSVLGLDPEHLKPPTAWCRKDSSAEKPRSHRHSISVAADSASPDRRSTSGSPDIRVRVRPSSVTRTRQWWSARVSGWTSSASITSGGRGLRSSWTPASSRAARRGSPFRTRAGPDLRPTLTVGPASTRVVVLSAQRPGCRVSSSRTKIVWVDRTCGEPCNRTRTTSRSATTSATRTSSTTSNPPLVNAMYSSPGSVRHSRAPLPSCAARCWRG